MLPSLGYLESQGKSEWLQVARKKQEDIAEGLASRCIRIESLCQWGNFKLSWLPYLGLEKG